MSRRQPLWIGLAVLSLLPAPARAEQVEIVTYYPSPSATTDDLRVKRATVGSDYKALNLDDPLATIPDGTLLVEGSIGIGTSRPPLTAPDGSTAGNLNVNNIFVRSLNGGVGAWVSEALAGGLEPSKPYTVYLSVPAGGSATYDVYTALQLWKYGVTRDRVRIATSYVVSWNGPTYDGPSGGWIGWGPTARNWPPGLGYAGMPNGDGVVMITSNSGAAVVQVGVTW